MCSICKEVLVGFGVEHTEARCPLRNSRYCANCAKYGHLTTACPAMPSIYFREPAFLEQLIPHTMLKEFGITTMTPIVYNVQEKPQRLLEIKDNDKVIAAYLSARSIKASKGKTKRYALEEYAQLNNRRVIYIK